MFDYGPPDLAVTLGAKSGDRSPLGTLYDTTPTELRGGESMELIDVFREFVLARSPEWEAFGATWDLAEGPGRLELTASSPDGEASARVVMEPSGQMTVKIIAFGETVEDYQSMADSDEGVRANLHDVEEKSGLCEGY